MGEIRHRVSPKLLWIEQTNPPSVARRSLAPAADNVISAAARMARMQSKREPFSYRTDPSVPSFADDCPIIIFDGHCALCVGWIRFVMQRDDAKRFRLLPAQSALGRALRTLRPRYGPIGDEHPAVRRAGLVQAGGIDTDCEQARLSLVLGCDAAAHSNASADGIVRSHSQQPLRAIRAGRRVSSARPYRRGSLPRLNDRHWLGQRPIPPCQEPARLLPHSTHNLRPKAAGRDVADPANAL